MRFLMPRNRLLFFPVRHGMDLTASTAIACKQTFEAETSSIIGTVTNKFKDPEGGF